ncbi:hypothetical protein AAFF_G00075430 [Aldrovandia affinis]|uniref:Uncharacterized protein n=1 Tax=Aldrovandia affinis TaxID=143900 RepID=A0AAD7RYA2_9TELE|nr:hypothetical protein AAFF_G00075430 [Aldrovandia affinis]
MEDFKEQISSTTPTIDELRHGSEYGMGDTNKLFDDAASYLLDNKAPATRDPMVDEDDILDLAGGARDAIERHKATLPRFEDPPKYSYTDLASRDAEPTAPEPGPDRWVTGRFGDPTEEPKTKTMDAFADTETPKAEPRIPAKDSYSPGTESPCDVIVWLLCCPPLFLRAKVTVTVDCISPSDAPSSAVLRVVVTVSQCCRGSSGGFSEGASASTSAGHLTPAL